MKTVIETAREVFDVSSDGRGRETFSTDSYGLERFAELVRAEEREALRKLKHPSRTIVLRELIERL